MGDRKEIEDDIKKDWKKMENTSKKIGLKEGISDGKESIFQSNFNEGFYKGFQTGYTIGQYKGALFARSKQIELHIEQEDVLLSHPKRAWCQICINGKFINFTIPEIHTVQTKISNKNLHDLHQMYFEKCNVDLPITINC